MYLLGFPYRDRRNGVIAERTSGAIAVVALLSRYTLFETMCVAIAVQSLNCCVESMLNPP